jgi:hypothetical protein
MSFYNKGVPPAPLLSGSLSASETRAELAKFEEIVGSGSGSSSEVSIVSVTRKSAFNNFLNDINNFRVLPFEFIGFSNGSDVSINIPGPGDTFTVTTDGIYELAASVAVNIELTGGLVFTSVINGGVPSVFSGAGTSYYEIQKSVSGSIKLDLLAGDTVQIVAYRIRDNFSDHIDLLDQHSIISNVSGSVVPTTASLQKIIL